MISENATIMLSGVLSSCTKLENLVGLSDSNFLFCKMRTGSFVKFLQFCATFLKPLSALSIAKYIRQVITAHKNNKYSVYCYKQVVCSSFWCGTQVKVVRKIRMNLSAGLAPSNFCTWVRIINFVIVFI